MTPLDRAIRELHEPPQPVSVSWRIDTEIYPDGFARPIGTVFIVNGACPLACLYCGLYRGMDRRPAAGKEVAAQIEAARREMPGLAGLKIYNASSLFEPASIRQTPEDLSAIAKSVDGLDLVVVEARAENASRARELASRISGRLEVAIGLEVADDRILALLNKPTTVGRFRKAAEGLAGSGIFLRSFVLVGPPFVPAEQAHDLALETFELARDCGSRVVSFLPVKASHAPMHELERRGYFSPPTLPDFFDVVSSCAGRGPVVLAETDWLSELPACPTCRDAMAEALRSLNERGLLPPVACEAHAAPERRAARSVSNDVEAAAALA